MTVGSITIGTKLDTSKFDKQISNLEGKIKKEEQKTLIIKAEAKGVNKQLKSKDEEVANIKKVRDEYKQLLDVIQKRQETDAQRARYTELRGIYKSPTNLEKQYNAALVEQSKLEAKAQQLVNRYNEATNNAEQFRKKIEEINVSKGNYIEEQKALEIEKRKKEEIEQQKEAYENLKAPIEGTNNSLQRSIVKIAKIALGVFGIRRAYTFLRQASSEYAQTNKQYGANLEYIRWALAQMVAPVLEYILNLAKTILAYINYIAQAWFGVNLFANATAKSFEKTKKSLKGANSSAKELKKTLAGFDEMNILNSNSTGGGGGAGGAFTMPDFDLSDMSNIQIPDWIKWIAENKDIVLGALGSILALFVGIKAIGFVKDLINFGVAMGTIINKFVELRAFLFGAGIALILVGIVQALISIVQWLENPTWDNFKGVLIGLEVAAAGLAATMIALNATNPVGWMILAVDAAAALGTWIYDLAHKDEELAKAEEKVATKEELVDYLNGRVIESSKRLKDAREGLTNSTKNYTDAVKNAEEKEKALQKAQDDTGISIDELLKWMDAENKDYKDLNENQRKVYDAYINNKIAQENLSAKTKELTEAQNQENQSLANLASALGYATTDAGIFKDAVVKAFKEGKVSAEGASKLIGAKMADMSEDARKAFVEDLPEDISKGLNPSAYQKYADTLHNWWNNKFIGGFQKEVDLTAHAIANVDLNIKGADSLKGISNLIKNLKNQVNGLKGGQGYATGAIVNMPGSGVPIASGVMGEAGREGIIPLTDAQAMAQLGEEIGRNVIINLNNVTQLNGRVLSKELKQVSAEQSFAFNS
jgi:hypothetical protein